MAPAFGMTELVLLGSGCICVLFTVIAAVAAVIFFVRKQKSQ